MQNNALAKRKYMFISCIFLVLGALNIIIWSEVLRNENSSDLEISFFNVGQGDSEFIRSRDGTQILIDGGPDSRVLSELKDHMPYYDRTIDVVIATHPHRDHITGLIEILQRYHVDTFIESGVVYSGPEFYELEKTIQQTGTHRMILQRPMNISFFNNAKLYLLTPLGDFASTTPKNIHDANIVGELEFQKRKILFMGDAEKRSEDALSDNAVIQAADVLKVGHHGSKTSSTKDLLSAVRPKYSIVSVGNNRYGHPHQITLDALKDIGTKIFRTDVDGTIVADIQNGMLRVYAQK